MTCIVTFARSWQALVATRALGKKGIRVVTADSDEFATSFFSRHSQAKFIYTNPEIDQRRFVHDLIDCCKQYKKKWGEDVMILPIHKETYTIAKYKKQISRYAKLCIEDYDKIVQVNNKGKLALLLDEQGISTPKSYVITDMLDLYKLVPKMQFPVFIKVRESAASLGIRKVEERDELIHEFREMVKSNRLAPPDYPIIQEAVAGNDYCVTAILNKGMLRAMMIYQNIKSYPYKSGTGVYRKTVVCPKMEQEAKRFLKAINWHGVIELDYRMAKDGKPYMIEANPRFWGGLNQAIASNVNYPLLAYDIAMRGDCMTVKAFDRSVRTENLMTATMGLMDEIYNNKEKKRELAKLRHSLKYAFKDKQNFEQNMRLFFRHWSRINKKKYTAKLVDEFIQRRKKVKDDLLDSEDPFVFLGIFYPLNLWLKYGKVDKFMLTGERAPKKK